MKGNCPSSAENPISLSSIWDTAPNLTVRSRSFQLAGVLILPENTRNLSLNARPVNHWYSRTGRLWMS